MSRLFEGVDTVFESNKIINEAEVPEKMIQNALKLKSIADDKHPSLTSEAGQEWDRLYKEDRSNVSLDLEGRYRLSIGYGGSIQITSSHPYNDTQYSFADASFNEDGVYEWRVYCNNKSVKLDSAYICDTMDEALDEMKAIDFYIESGNQTRDYEGISRNYPREDISFNEYKKTLSK